MVGRLFLQVDPESRLSIKRDKNHVLFSGTKILQHTGDKSARIRTPDNGCLAVVLRTGFETSQGMCACLLGCGIPSIPGNLLEPVYLLQGLGLCAS